MRAYLYVTFSIFLRQTSQASSSFLYSWAVVLEHENHFSGISHVFAYGLIVPHHVPQSMRTLFNIHEPFCNPDREIFYFHWAPRVHLSWQVLSLTATYANMALLYSKDNVAWWLEMSFNGNGDREKMCFLIQAVVGCRSQF